MCRPEQCTGACAQQAACGNTPLDMGTGDAQPRCAVEDPRATRRTLWLHAETHAAPAASAAEESSREGGPA